MIMFWVTDNFLMHHKRKARPIATITAGDEATMLKRVKARNYRAPKTNRQHLLLLNSGDSSESDLMTMSDDDDDNELLLNRSNLKNSPTIILSETPDQNQMVHRTSVISLS